MTAATLAGLLLAVLAVPAAGSVRDEPSGEESGLVLTSETLEPPARNTADAYEVAGMGPLVIPSGSDRGYLLTGARKIDERTLNLAGGRLAQPKGFSRVAAYDVQEARPSGVAAFFPHVPFTTTVDTIAPAHHLVPDTEGRYLFMPHGSDNVALDAVGAEGNSGSTAVDGSFCAARSFAGAGGNCTFGVHVLNRQTLEVVRSIPLRFVQAESGSPSPWLRAMSYAPSRGNGDAGKLLLLVEEASTFSAADATRGPRWTANEGVFHLVQIDPEAGRQDWAYRVAACRGQRELRNWQGFGKTVNLPNPAIVARAPSLDAPSIMVACHSGGTGTGTVVRIPLDRNGAPVTMPLRLADHADAATVPQADSRPAPPVGLTEQPLNFYGPDRVLEYHYDERAQRLLMRVVDGSPLAEVWWIFDLSTWRLLGTVGMGTVGVDGENISLNGFDPESGRLYVLMPGGTFLVADTRRNPIAQALSFPGFENLRPASAATYFPLTVQPGTPTVPTRIYVPMGAGTSGYTHYRVVEDHTPLSVDAGIDHEYAGRTVDLMESPGVTQATLDGAARGYGARVLLVGGIESLSRTGPFDFAGNVWAFGDEVTLRNQGTTGTAPWDLAGAPRSPCSDVNRDIILGFVGPTGPAVVDGSGARGTAEPVVVDSSTRADGETPASRCGALTTYTADWERLWGTPLFGGPPVAEPGGAWPFDDRVAECVSASGAPTSAVGDPIAGAYAAQVSCAHEETSGYAYARGAQIKGLHVAEALSGFRIYRDHGRGIVSRVESVARGVSLDGVLRIDTVRGVAESWANGRKFTPPAPNEAEYDANCDFERTAGSCFRRHVFGVWTPGFACGPCGDETTALDRISRGMGQYGAIRMRDPDPVLARGADNGFIAAVTKPDGERFADLVLNNDLLQTVVPTLEVIRYAPPNRVLIPGGQRGRQIYQFAGVEVSSSYGIACLLVYDEVTNTCAEAAEPPGSITVSLADADGKPLAGGAFEVRSDVDADGVLGLKDTLLPNGACVTTDDGVGTCSFENLQPGSYLVSQVAAPPGYGRSAEPFVVELASGEARTVAFTNVSNLSSIELKVSDEAGSPLAGAVFAAYPDSDADGKVAPDAKPAAECTTDAQGVCSMQVPAGSYVLVQTSAPGGLEGIEPVPFTFASGGQVAAVTVVNYPPDSPQQPDAPAAPIYTPPVDVAPPAEFVDEGYTPPSDSEVIAPETAPGPSIGEQVGGTVVQVVRAPGDALRLLSRDPKQAVAWTAALALFCLAALAVRRRQQAMALLEH